MTWLARMMCLGFVVTAYSQVRVHVLQREAIIAKALETGRHTVSRVDKARRGPILTADGKPLAQDDETYEFGVQFGRVPTSEGFFNDLASAADIPASELSHLAARGAKNRVWREPISAARAKRILEVKRRWRADGVSLSPTGRRAYPLGYAAAGFVGSMAGGKPTGGLEMSRNPVLAGQDGKQVGLVDRRGSYLPMRLESISRDRRDGAAIVTTIDSSLQQAAAAAVRTAVEHHNAVNGVAVVMDPRTGDLLAMANWPSYDPEALQRAVGRDIKAPDYNPNYMGSLEPGSMFKILTLAKAFDEGVAHVGDTYHCTGIKPMGRAKPVKCDVHNGTRAHGKLDTTLVISKSCNVISATWSLAVGYDKMLAYLKDLGLLSKTNLGVPFEKPGQFNFKEWDKRRQIADVGFGQSVNATPVALTSAFGMLANHGVRMQPRLVKRIGSRELAPESAGQIVSPESAAELMRAMQAVIETDSGTGHTLRIPGYRLAGKTGTAQKIGSAPGAYVSNFVGYVPAVEPKAVVLVMIDHPRKGVYYGASVAGPVFKDVARAVIRRFAIAPTEDVVR